MLFALVAVDSLSPSNFPFFLESFNMLGMAERILLIGFIVVTLLAFDLVIGDDPIPFTSSVFVRTKAE